MNRRHFLKASAGFTLTLPLFESLAPRQALAQASGAGLRRFIAWCQPLGTFGEEFWPNSEGQALWNYPTGIDCPDGWGPNRCRAKEFRTGQTAQDFELNGTSNILEPLLERHRSRLTVIENVNNAGGNHGSYSSMLTGSTREGRSISIDQRLAPTLSDGLRFDALQLGVRSSTKIGDRYTVSYRGNNRGLAPSSNPRANFERIFSGVTTDDSAADRLLSIRGSILDGAMGQASRLRARLSNPDQQRLEQYFDAVRSLETRISQMPTTQGCFVPEPPIDDPRATDERRDLDLVPSVAEAQVDLLAFAFACDLTRVATFQMAFEATNMTHPWLNVTGRWHDLSHNDGAGENWQDLMQQYVRISRWNAQLIGRLADQLQSLGALDGTAILWINPMNNGQVHNSRNLPIAVLSENAGLRQRRHVRFEHANAPQVNDLHRTLLTAAGLEAGTFGDADRNNRVLSELLA